MSSVEPILSAASHWGRKKTNKQKTHKHFSDGPCGTIVPGTNPHPSQGQTGQNRDFTVELNRERQVCPRDGSHFVPERGPICPRDGSRLSRRPSRRKCLCLLVFLLPEPFWLPLSMTICKPGALYNARVREVQFAGHFLGLLIFSGEPVAWEFRYGTPNVRTNADCYKYNLTSTCLYNVPSLRAADLKP